jgi:hypothetical protein
MIIQNCQTIQFSTLSVRQKEIAWTWFSFLKPSVLIITDNEVDVSCVLLLEKIVRQLTGDVRVVAPEGKSRRRIQFPVRVREPDKSAFRDQGHADRLRAPRITRSWISARPCPRGIA